MQLEPMSDAERRVWRAVVVDQYHPTADLWDALRAGSVACRTEVTR